MVSRLLATHSLVGVRSSPGTVFVNNRTQAVRLPLVMRRPKSDRKVNTRANANEGMIASLVGDNFLPERSAQYYGAIRAAPEKQ